MTVFDGIVTIISNIALAVRNVLDNCRIETQFGVFTLWHFLVVLILIGIILSVFVRTGKA